MYSLRATIDLDHRLQEVDANWALWTADEPVLQQFSSAEEVRQWRFRSPWQERREVILAIGRLTQHPAHSELAMLTLLHLCIDEAAKPLSRVAQAAGESRAPDAAEAVSHLWIACREYPWDEPRAGWVTLDLVRDAQRAMLKELDWGGRVTKWGNEGAPVLGGPEVFENRPAPNEQMQDEELGEVLQEALKDKAVAREDVELLLELAVLADENKVKSTGKGGLLSEQVCGTVAKRHDIGIWAVRKRALKILDTLRDHSQEAV